MSSNHQLNLMLIGHQMSGKSQIVESYISEKPQQNDQENIETNAVLFFQKEYQLDQKKINLFIADTPGVESHLFERIFDLMIQNQQIIVLVFDLCNEQSLDFQNNVSNQLKKQTEKTICLLGTQNKKFQKKDEKYIKQVKIKIDQLKLQLNIKENVLVKVDGNNIESIKLAIQKFLEIHGNKVDRKYNLRQDNSNKGPEQSCQLI
ncbi:hypothetical protein ABPG74_022012 [Tetrahymena malaccensis]